MPSGDRAIARLLVRALADAGHEVRPASAFRSWDGAGDRARQQRLRSLGGRLAERLLRRFARPGATLPECWFTYHLYHKAPDWLGPRVAGALGLPYVVAEASVAPKRAGGPWDLGYRAALAALLRSDGVIAFNSSDLPGLRAVLPESTPLWRLAPAIDVARLPPPARRRGEVAAEYGLPEEEPWLVAVAMMRPGNKEDSYRFLARVLSRLGDRPWRAFLIGDGPRRAGVEGAFAALPAARLRFTGALPPPALARVVAVCDLFVWPALDEPLGMAMLEAQALGVPVVAAAARGVPDVVHDGRSGLLLDAPNPTDFARAVAALLDDPPRRRRFAEEGPRVVAEQHSPGAFSRRLDRCLEEAARLRRARNRRGGRR